MAFTTFTENPFFQGKVVLESCPALRTFFLEKMKVYSLSSQAKLNTVPNTLVMCCEIVCYERICEGCESKKSKIAVCARICARVREPSHQAKREEKIWMREKGKSVRAVGDKNVRPISKNVGDFPKNVGENLEKLRRFLRNLRSLVVMLAGCG